MTSRFVGALTLLNLTLVAALALRADATVRDPIPPVLKARAFELVDERGVLRSRIEVKDGGLVEFQMFDGRGVIKVKLGAGEHGSGLYLGDETQETGVQIIARRVGTADQPMTTGIRLTGANSSERVVTP